MNDVLRTTWRLLTFRATRDELLAVDSRHLAFGLISTWLVGMGRYWDDPRANALQHLGVGSVVYVFALSLLLYLVTWPLAPRDWSYRRLLTFVTLLAPPAALYAIPVERFVGAAAARDLNMWFLVVVALWRVSLLFFYLGRVAQLRTGAAAVAGLLPLTAIVTVLFALNLHHVTFDLMGGIRNPSPHDGAYGVLFVLTMVSYLGVIPLLLAYAVLVVAAQRLRYCERKRLRDAGLAATQKELA
jgi:hypothetical protein